MNCSISRILLLPLRSDALGTYCLPRSRLIQSSVINMSAKAKAFVDEKVASGKKVVMFSKSTCGFCIKTKDVLKKQSLPADQLEIIEMNQMDNMSDMQDYLLSITGGRSVPRVFVNGKFLGGCDDTVAAHNNGKLKAMLA